MSRKAWTVILVVIGVLCIGGALYYPISRYLQQTSQEEQLDALRNLKGQRTEPANAPLPAATAETERATEDASQGTEDTVFVVVPEPTDQAAAVTAETDRPHDAVTPKANEKNVAVSLSADGPEPDGTPYSSEETSLVTPGSAPAMTPQPIADADTQAPADMGPMAVPAPTPPAPAMDEETITEAPTSPPAHAIQSRGGNDAASASAAPTAPPPTATPGEAASAPSEPGEKETPAVNEPDAELPIAEEHGTDLVNLSQEEIREEILPRFRDLYALNADFIGWLSIPGTEVDHPVVQTPWQNDYYLYRDFYGQDNKNGTLILEGSCDPWTPGRNLIIYGHKMRSGLMFGKLDQYLNKDYWASHKLITFDVLLSERTYVVIAALQSIQIEGGGLGSFRYTAEFADEEDLASWLDYIRRRRQFDTGIDFGVQDHYLTLSTCSYHDENGRLLVIARELRPGEDADHPEAAQPR